MSEKLSDKEFKPENFEATEHHENETPKPKEAEHERDVIEDKHDVAELHRNAAEKAISAKEISITESIEAHKQQSPLLAQKELKADAYSRTLNKIRRHLNPADRALSKVIHLPAIDMASNFSSKTIARPSGILGGGLFAFLGSGLLLYISKFYGFEYNFTIFLILFAAGFVVGVLAELLLRASKT